MDDEIRMKYKKLKIIYFGLIASLFAIIIALRFIAPADEHKATPLELMMLASLIGIVIAIYGVFRCPKCNAGLVLVYSSQYHY